MKMKRVYILFTVLCGLIFMGGCATKEEKAILEAVEKQAKIHASQYISEKYGFEAEIIDARAETREGTLFPSYTSTGYAYVTAKYGDKEFDIYITGENAYESGRDTYQKEEILEAIEKKAGEIFKFLTDNLYVNVNYKGVYEDLMITTYYDGNNIEEIINEPEVSFKYRVVTTDVKLESMYTDDIERQLGDEYEAIIINCHDYEGFIKVKQADFTGVLKPVQDYSIYVDDYLEFSAYDKEYVDYELVEFEDFSIVMQNGTYCNAIEEDVQASSWKGRGYVKPKQVFEAYKVDTDADRIFVFVYTDGIDEEDCSKAQIAMKFYKDGELYYESGTLSVNHYNYVTDAIWSKNYTDIIFTVLIDEE